MAVFPILELEAKVQTNEKTRLSGIKSYLTQNEAAVVLVRIKPSANDSFITVSATDPTDASAWYLDWQYASAGTQTVTIEMSNGVGPTITTVSKDIEVVLPADEKLFSSDYDLAAEEPDILSYIKPGRANYNDIHRVCQYKIMDEIYRSRIFNSDGNKLTIAEVLDVEELRPWSKYMALKLIFMGMSNSVDDVFQKRSELYASYEQKAYNEAMNQMRLDYNKDGINDKADQKDWRSVDLIRR